MPAGGKRPRDGTDARRMTHNASEQRRAKRINEQISSLRQLMKATGMLGDKNDKGSILEAASTFIQRAMAAESTAPPASLPVAKPAASAGVVSIDYASVFQSNGVAQAIAAMDGSFVDCNKKFCELSGFSRHEIRQRSIFNMTPQSDLQRTFEIVSAMMNSVGGSGGVESTQFSKSCKMRGGLTNVRVTMAVIRDAAGNAVNFACAIIPTGSDEATLEGSMADLFGPESPPSAPASSSSSSSSATAAAAAAAGGGEASYRSAMLPVAYPSTAPGGQPAAMSWQSATSQVEAAPAPPPASHASMSVTSIGASPSGIQDPQAMAAAGMPKRSAMSLSAPSTVLNGLASDQAGPASFASLPHAGFGRAVTGITAGRRSGSLSIAEALARRSRQQRMHREQAELMASQHTPKAVLPGGMAGIDSMGSDARALEVRVAGSTRAVLRNQGQSSLLASTNRAPSSAGTSLSGLHMPALHTHAVLRHRGQSADSELSVGAMDPDEGMGGLSMLSAASARGLGHSRDGQPPPMSFRDQSGLSVASHPLPPPGSQSGLLPLGMGGLSIMSDPRNGVRGDLSLVSDIPGLEDESQMGINATDLA